MNTDILAIVGIITALCAIATLGYLARQQSATTAARQQSAIDRGKAETAADMAIIINALRDDGLQKDRALDAMTSNWREEKARADRLSERLMGGPHA